VYDITSAKSFENLTQWHTDFISKAGPKDAQNFPFFLFGNKCDRVEDRKVSQDTVNKWTKMNNNIPYEETSAINGRNIEESFMKIAKHLLLHQLSTQENQLL
jgi:Ras-related protein Rab-7A